MRRYPTMVLWATQNHVQEVDSRIQKKSSTLTILWSKPQSRPQACLSLQSSTSPVLHQPSMATCARNTAFNPQITLSALTFSCCNDHLATPFSAPAFTLHARPSVVKFLTHLRYSPPQHSPAHTSDGPTNPIPKWAVPRTGQMTHRQ